MDIEKLFDCYAKPYKEYCLVPVLHSPIVNEPEKLLTKLKKYELPFPRVVQLLRNMLEKNIVKNPCLEDWLIIMPYEWVWNNNEKSLAWLSDCFNTLNHEQWHAWVNEVVQKCDTTNDIGNRLYDYLTAMFASIYLTRRGIFNFSFPLPQENVDIIGYDNKGFPFAIECKFLRTSDKFRSAFSRIYVADISKKRIISSDNVRFPSSLDIKQLTKAHITGVKAFYNEIHKNPLEKHKALLYIDQETFIFEYNPLLQNATPIDSQTDYAHNESKYFEEKLNKIIHNAIKQLTSNQYKDHKKIIFVGTQLDLLYSTDWTYDAISKIKIQTKKILDDKNIEIIFGEDVGFSMERYI